MYRYVLFDLDGTLSDPKVGICTSVQYALNKMGIEEPDIDKLEPFIGPPLRDSFKEYYDMDSDQAEQAVTFYRERFSTIGKFENEIYPGIPELLSDLKKKGRVVAIASSKPTCFVKDILEHFEIDQYFDVVVGSELDGSRDTKEEVLKETLNQMFEGGEIDYDEVVMVGDRKYDIEAALSFGVHNIGVSYGYGSREELEEAGADKIVNTVVGLRNTLIPLMGTTPSYGRPQNAGPQGEGEKKSPEDWKQASKEAGRQSFSNTWGFVGPALLLWLGGTAINYIINLIIILIFKDTLQENPEFITENTAFIIFGLSQALAVLFLFKDIKKIFKNTKNKNSEIETGTETKPETVQASASIDVLSLVLVGLAAVIFAVGFTGFGKAFRDYGNALVASTEGLENTAEAAAAPKIYCGSLILNLIVYGILIAIPTSFVYVRICFYRARKNMKGFLPFVLCAVLFGFMNANTGKGLLLAFLMGIAMYMYDRSRNLPGSVLTFSLSYMGIVLVDCVPAINSALGNFKASGVISLVGLALAIYVMTKNKPKEA